MEKFTESLYTGGDLDYGYGQTFHVDEIVFHEKSEFQDLIIFKNKFFGHVMVLDGVVQLTEKDEFIYHEMMAHVPILSIKSVKEDPNFRPKVLIIGGGDGGVLRHCLMHDNVDVKVIEIDASVVEMSKKYFPKISDGAFDNPRTDLVICDGIKFVRETDEKFDVIIVDSTDPIGVGEVLFTQEFYTNCHKLLNENGIVTTQNGVPFFQGEEITTTYNRMKAANFHDNRFIVVAQPTYVGGFMTLGWASRNLNYAYEIRYDALQRAWNNSSIKGKTKYYNPEIHLGTFALPQYIKNLMV